MNMPTVPDSFSELLSFIVAVLIVGALIYWAPWLTIGIIIGYAIASKKDAIQKWIDENKED
jgi:uncharacterized oligopeptide transporter (OPT) family protein